MTPKKRVCVSLLAVAALLAADPPAPVPNGEGPLGPFVALAATVLASPPLAVARGTLDELEPLVWQAGAGEAASLEIEAIGIGDDNRGAGTFDDLGLEIDLGLPFLPPGVARARRHTARAEWREARAEYKVLVAETLTESLDGFLDYVQAAAILALQEDSLSLMEETVALQAARLAAGDVPEADLIRLQSEVARFRLGVELSRDEAEEIFADLAERLQVGDLPRPDAVAATALLAADPPSAATLSAGALATHPVALLATSSLAAADSRLALARVEGRKEYAWRVGADIEDDDWSFRLAFERALGLGSRGNRGAVASAAASLRVAGLARQSAGLRLELAQGAAVAAYVRVEEMHDSFRDGAVALVLEAMAVSKDGYLEGVTGLLPWLDAQRVALEVQERLMEIRTLRWRRALRLAAANGALLDLLEVSP
ncbi:TolC family protein [bacterium]|nr:TolC family protein [bacterium]